MEQAYLEELFSRPGDTGDKGWARFLNIGRLVMRKEYAEQVGSLDTRLLPLGGINGKGERFGC